MEHFPRDISIQTINYLDDEKESLYLLEILGIDEKYYISKLHHRFASLEDRLLVSVPYFNDFIRYKVNKFIINNEDELDIISNLNIIEIKFGNNFDQPVNNYPKKVFCLTFGVNFNQKVDNLPNKLKFLKFGFEFNQTVDKLPKNLNRLELGYSFNRPVDNLPNNLIYLKFGYYFNQKVDNLPPKITYLGFSHDFNQRVDNLPKNIEYLAFGYSFNQTINNLPESLIILKFGDTFDQPVDLLKYKKLKIIKVMRVDQQNLFKNKPDTCVIVQDVL